MEQKQEKKTGGPIELDKDFFLEHYIPFIKMKISMHPLSAFIENKSELSEILIDQAYQEIDPKKIRNRGYITRLLNRQINDAIDHIEKQIIMEIVGQNKEAVIKFQEGFMVWAINNISKRWENKYKKANINNKEPIIDDCKMAEEALRKALKMIKEEKDNRSIIKISNHALNSVIKMNFSKAVSLERKTDKIEDWRISLKSTNFQDDDINDERPLSKIFLRMIDVMKEKKIPICLSLKKIFNAIIFYCLDDYITEKQCITLQYVLEGYESEEISDKFGVNISTIIQTRKIAYENLERCYDAM